MAIQFARIEIVSRSSGGNACRKGAYNARTSILDEQNKVIYNFQGKGDNVYHEILLPDGADQKFKDTKTLMNAIEKIEKRKDSQLLKDAVIALPDDKELNLNDRIEITKRIVERSGWVKNGLAVQIDIHKPHDGEKNWHAHLLITTRRFINNGKEFGEKARDLNPEFKNTGSKTFIIPEETLLQHHAKDVINDYFKELGLENRVDEISVIPQEHIGPVRMRSILNEAANRNEERVIANIELLKDGSDVLERVSKCSSVFSKKDLIRVVKCVPNSERANSLVNDAISDERAIPLYHSDGSDTGLFTTTEVRDEEVKLLRLSSYIATQSNLISQPLGGAGQSNISAQQLIESYKEEFAMSQQQAGAFSHLIDNEGGIRVLKGRAGTGKSYVLGKVVSIAKAKGVEVIGLAPTHKAKMELGNVGYDRCDTIKGFLFKLYNDRVDLSKHSLIVVDEAAMVSNADWLELLRIAAAKNCNVILAGDERQLSSIQRGGMFSSFADKFGCFELNDIRRQEVAWSREVARAFSESDVREGINILKSNDRLINNENKTESMERLLLDWGKSQKNIGDKLIIAIKNSDVDILNKGARPLLKGDGTLTGLEYFVGNRGIVGEGIDKTAIGFMKGDRIVFKETDKDIGVNNGDFGELIEVGYKTFAVKLDRGEQIEFNPNEFIGFKHGYASTVFKVQGSSIRDVYVLHDGFSTMKNSYVAMSRHVEDLHLYTNKQATKNEEQLINQLKLDPEHSASINYLTKVELDELQKQNHQDQAEKNQGLLAKLTNKITEFAQRKITTLTDKHMVNRDYYIFEKPSFSNEKVEEILDIMGNNERLYLDTTTYKELKSQEVNGKELNEIEGELGSYRQERMVVGGYNFAEAKSVQTTKERFYRNVEYQRSKSRENKIDYQYQDNRLREIVKHRAEEIGQSFFGEPSKHLSNRSTLRYGDNGKIALRISGEKSGSWYDFSKSKGGDLFDLVQDKQNCDFKGAASYLRDRFGISDTSHLRLVHDSEAKDKYVDYYRQSKQEQATYQNKMKKARDLYEKADLIKDKSVAYRYLSQNRRIDCELSKDIKTTNIFDKELKTELPAIIAFARNTNGEITGGQQIFLDSETNQKANISTPKRSFGKIAGSFVEISNRNLNSNPCEKKITIIAEGLETALSIKQAGIEIDAKILCSLGISNIKNYTPIKGERILIAGDNDGDGASSVDVTNKAKEELENKGAIVAIVTPETIGDFNDILKDQGQQSIKDIIDPAIRRLKNINPIEQQPPIITPIITTIEQQIADIEKQLTGLPILDRFKENIADLTRFASPKDLHEAMNCFSSTEAKGRGGLESFNERSYKICQQIINDKINLDLKALDDRWVSRKPEFKDAKISDFRGNVFEIKNEYLASIGKDTQVTRYIDKTSDLGQEIQYQLNRSIKRELNRGIDI